MQPAQPLPEDRIDLSRASWKRQGVDEGGRHKLPEW